MTQRKQSFWYTLLLITPFVLSFLSITSFKKVLNTNTISIWILSIALIVYLFDKKNRSYKEMYSCFKLFALFALYMAIIGIWNDKYMFFSMTLILSSTFSFSFLGYDFKRYSVVGYLYASVATVIALDFVLDGLTAGFNTNTVAMFAINGVLFICLVNDMQDNKFIVFNTLYVVVLCFLINATNCRSVFIALLIYLLLRYIVFKRKKISKWFYRSICVLFVTSPYWVMQIYLTLYNGSSRDNLNKFFFEQTGKVLFTEREVIWQDLFRKIIGEKYWFGFGDIKGNAHNIYMDIWHCFGLIGCIFFAVLFIMILFKLYKHISDSIIKSSVCCFLGIIVSQSFECSYFKLATQNCNIILYLFLAIAIGRYIYLEQQQKSILNGRMLYET